MRGSLSPEAAPQGRAQAPAPGSAGHVPASSGPAPRAFEVTKRVLVGAYNDGFIHAGNLAYMAILAIFPFFILGAAISRCSARKASARPRVNAISMRCRPIVGDVIEPVARSVIRARRLAAVARRAGRPVDRRRA